MTAWLRQHGDPDHEKRGRRVWRQRGLRAVYPKPHVSPLCAGGPRSPDLRPGVRVDRAEHGWATDRTAVRLWPGFGYLVAMMDWSRRSVLSWEVSITLESRFGVSALEHAWVRAQPAIGTADHGAQFTSLAGTERWLERRRLISMDGRGRACDHLLVERLWRSVTSEEGYVQDYRSVQDAIKGWRSYCEFYNGARRPQSLNYQTPEAVDRQGQTLAAAATCNGRACGLDSGEHFSPNVRGLLPSHRLGTGNEADHPHDSHEIQQAKRIGN